MSKFYKLLFIISILISGCNINNIEEKKINQVIDSFNMNIYSNKGEKILLIKSPSSSYDIVKRISNLKQSTIYIYDNNKPQYIIKSNNSILSNNNKLLELYGNVVIKKLPQKDDILYSDRFIWNINKSEYKLIGKVKFENSNIVLLSNKASLSKGSDIVEFFNPVKYIIKKSNDKKSYEINSENAFYNVKTRSVSFQSKEDRVRSKLYF